jgi:hypothetical protein
MQGDDRDILQVLKTELQFLRRGGYRRVARAPWRAPLYFEDSPSCPRLRQFSHKSQPCQDCVLFQLVSPEAQDENVPCQHIPLTADGQLAHALSLGHACRNACRAGRVVGRDDRANRSGARDVFRIRDAAVDGIATLTPPRASHHARRSYAGSFHFTLADQRRLPAAR